ncbi:hypothetical protein JR316_0007708 [Psilocybe cubensis]|uniref:Uncharacterized protein n=1 Tax=Psilocybe cubensis TaxID=181762 RepID=A0ACB8GUI5_PSICU|nr:hypothetical protein JR316_0007708 [Psilocybe cubensis]KAH9479129.1 hypothetical protein JR316_0007708 [Psilocybe cubensis]
MSTRFSREDTLILLESLGISLPPTTKISLDDLNKRLKDALDAAQRLHAVIETLPLNPADHPIWPADKDLEEATRKFNFKEAIQMRLANAAPKVSSNKKDTFWEMRKVVTSFAQESPTGREFCMSDTLGELVNWGVYVNVTQIRCIKDTPVYILVYKEVIPQKGQTLYDALESVIGTSNRLLINVQTTDFERQSMLKLFRMNAKRLSPNFHAIDEKKAQKMGLKTSFVLPLGPLNMKDTGKFSNVTGCEVCGKTNVKCQKQDWPNHKLTCRSLKGGTWRTLTFEVYDAVFLSHSDHTSQIETANAGVVPPDIHNGKVFLVKFQISLMQFKDEAHMLIYDRQRSFRGIWKRCKERDLFDEAEDSMGDNLRMYRWARRVGDYQLSVCLDRPPAKDPVW